MERFHHSQPEPGWDAPKGLQYPTQGTHATVARTLTGWTNPAVLGALVGAVAFPAAFGATENEEDLEPPDGR